MANEPEYQVNVVKELLSEGSFPPKFTFGKDEAENLHFLENEVVCHVLLDVIVELNLYRYVDNLDSLFCLAAAALSCALAELRDGHFTNTDFTADGYQLFYDNVIFHISTLLIRTSDPRSDLIRYDPMHRSVPNTISFSIHFLFI